MEEKHSIILNKCKKITFSCTTIDQLRIAGGICDRAFKDGLISEYERTYIFGIGLGIAHCIQKIS